MSAPGSSLTENETGIALDARIHFRLLDCPCADVREGLITYWSLLCRAGHGPSGLRNLRLELLDKGSGQGSSLNVSAFHERVQDVNEIC